MARLVDGLDRDVRLAMSRQAALEGTHEPVRSVDREIVGRLVAGSEVPPVGEIVAGADRVGPGPVTIVARTDLEDHGDLARVGEMDLHLSAREIDVGRGLQAIGIANAPYRDWRPAFVGSGCGTAGRPTEGQHGRASRLSCVRRTVD